MKHQDHEGIEPVEVDPNLQVNRDHVLNTNHLNIVNAEVPSTRTSSTGIEVDLKYYLPLYQAARKGDWESARSFIERDPDASTAKISMRSMTALHVAASAGHSQFVKKLVEHMPTEALEMRDNSGRTALHYAAIGESAEAAKALVRKNPTLTQITVDNGWTPLLYAALWAGKEVVWYLSLVTTDEPPSIPFTGPLAGRLICEITGAGFHDVALYLIKHYPNLASARDDKRSVLSVLAEKPSVFPSGSRLGFWRRCIIYPFIPVELNYAPLHLRRGDTEDPLENTGELGEVPTSIQSGTYLTRVPQWFNGLLWKAIERLGMQDFTAMATSFAHFIASTLIWFSYAAPSIKQVHDEKLRHKQVTELVNHVSIQMLQMDNSQTVEFFKGSTILTSATSFGTVEIVMGCLQIFPDLIWYSLEGRSILHIAVENRREKIFNLMREKIARNVLLASQKVESNNILHFAAKLPPAAQLKSVSGSAFQMQRELQWYKEVEKFARPYYKEIKNKNKKTAWELFTEEHKELVENGEKWMKDTSNSCMLVATLIATVVFAAAFTVPGGNTSDKGIPIFLKHNSFMVFAISDALALFSSSTSILTFLSILTSRYAEEDFLESLPKKLIIGLASLFFAIATMMIAFSAALSIVLGERLKGAFIPITLVACFPVTLFVMLQLPLFVQMVKSTYGSGIFHRQTNLTL